MHKLLNKLSTWAKGFFLKKEILTYGRKEMSQQRTICYLFCICVINCSNEFLHHLFQFETYFHFFVGMRKCVWMKMFIHFYDLWRFYTTIYYLNFNTYSAQRALLHRIRLDETLACFILMWVGSDFLCPFSCSDPARRFLPIWL